MTENLLVDSREDDKVFQVLDRLKVPYEKKFLDVADFNYGTMCIERKTIQDFALSVQGRLWQQLTNMKAQFPHRFLIINGTLKELQKNSSFTVAAFLGAIASISTRYGCNILQVDNETQLVTLVKLLCEKFDKGEISADEVHLRTNIGRIKDEKNVYVHMLSVVPGIGIDLAERVLAHFSFFQLKDITAQQLVESVEGIGQIKADKIKEFFH